MKQRPASSFSFIEPMKALLAPALPAGDWVYEMEYDGYRALAFKSGSDVQSVSRNRTSFNKVYPQLINALKLLPAKNAIIDGEIAALDQDGKPSFQLLQAYGKSKETPLIYYAFDLLKLEGKDLRNRPLVERRTLLAELLEKPPDNIRFSEELRGNRDQLLEVAHRFQLEGLVAKRPNSVYESGRRSAWVASARNTSAMLSPPRMLAFFSLVSPTTRTQVLPASCKAIVEAFLLVPLERSEQKRQENAVHLRVDQ